jgi:NAD(P)-dependent dehydrogenase (short-subunit alcohol dehydrogenase family)
MLFSTLRWAAPSEVQQTTAEATAYRHTYREVVKVLRDQIDLVLSTVNVNLPWWAYLRTLAPRGRLHLVGVTTEPLELGVPGVRQGSIASVSGSAIGSPTTIARMLRFAARHGIEPVVEFYPSDQAKEVGPFNICCNAVRPGAMNNERLRGVLRRVAADLGKSEEEILESELQYFSMRTLVEMKEVADMVYFLASDAAPHITGQIIAVDGNAEYET